MTARTTATALRITRATILIATILIINSKGRALIKFVKFALKIALFFGGGALAHQPGRKILIVK